MSSMLNEEARVIPEETRLTVLRLKQECSGGTPGTGEGGFVGEVASLQKYNEVLTPSEVNHILDKVAFGGNAELRNIGLTQGLTPLVNALVDGVYSNAERSSFNNLVDQWEALGRWEPEENEAPEEVWTTRSVQGGQMYRFIHSRNPFHEWMTLQLSAHFATDLQAIGFSFDWFRSYGLKQHVELLRSQSVGNFRDLTLAMYTDPAMNFWLGNKDNSIVSPNQNYARELLELFTLGAVDPYSLLPNYGEDTVVAATGFVSGYQEDIGEEPLFGNESVLITFDEELKDNTARTAFVGIPGAEITASMTAEGFLDHVLYNHPGSVKYIAERIAGNMLYPGIPENMALSLGHTLRSNNFNLKPMLKIILSSQAMFSSQASDACLASPIEQFVKMAKRIFPTDLQPEGDAWSGNFARYMDVVEAAARGGQRLFQPPSVFGWKKSCNINRNGVLAFGEEWVTAQLLLQRTHGCAELFNMLNDRETDYGELFNLDEDTTALQAVRSIAAQVYDLTLTPSEEKLLVQFLTQYTDDGRDGEFETIEPRFDREWYLRNKIPALVCSMGTIYRALLR